MVKEDTSGERRVLWVALVLNATMFVVGLAAGILAESLALVADSLDMLSDALAYGLSLAAIGRSGLFKARVARISGTLLLVLGVGVVLDVARRWLQGSDPDSGFMLGTALLSLLVNAYVIRTLARFRRGEVHLRAAWLFTRADVVANAGVILSGLLVLVTGSRYPDLIVGFAIGCYVIREAFEILKSARRSLAGAAVLLILAAAACQRPGGEQPRGESAKTGTPVVRQTGAPTVEGTGPGLSVRHSTQHGPYLTDLTGRALYLLEGDANASRCYDRCLGIWPPLFAAGRPAAVAGDSGLDARLTGSIKRRDGLPQVTFNGQPLYYYLGDGGPGQTLGHDVEDSWGEWYLVSPRGGQIEDRRERRRDADRRESRRGRG